MASSANIVLADGAAVRVKSPGVEGSFDRVLLARGDELPDNLADGEADRLEAAGQVGSSDDLAALEYVAGIRRTHPAIAAEAERLVAEGGKYADVVQQIAGEPSSSVAGGDQAMPEPTGGEEPTPEQSTGDDDDAGKKRTSGKK